MRRNILQSGQQVTIKVSNLYAAKGTGKNICGVGGSTHASVQSVINIAYPVNLKPGTQDAIKARVTNQILGGGFSARLMQNLREKHGYTYGAGSRLNPDNLIGNFNASASVRNEVTDSSVYEFISELKAHG
jgi:predicted Zn-dependent peptidase